MIEGFMKSIMSRYNLSKDQYANMLISITEAVNNAIIHGNKNDENKFVVLDLVKQKNCLCIKVSDEGKGFDLNSLKDPTCIDHISCEGGRGVFIMQQLADHICYHNNGRTVEMHFNI
jgi:serine/threonine-protein kinase RsbW